jgi:hypothetical protein
MSSNGEDYQKLKSCKRATIAKIKNQYLELYGKKMPADYKGKIIESTIQKACNKYNTIFRIFNINKNGLYEYTTKFFSDYESENQKGKG